MQGATALRRLVLAVLLAAGVIGKLTLAAAHETPAPGMLEVVRLDDGTVIQVEEFRGPPKLAALTHLFTHTHVDISCPNHKDYSVFVGADMAEVRAAYARGDRAWCGLAHLLRDSPNCTVAIAPYGSTYVAVAKPKTWLSGDESHSCYLSRHEQLSMPRLLAAVLGGFLFWNAGVLSESTPFRLTGGTLGFMALSSVVLLFVLYRRVPHKGKLLAGTAMFGGSFLAATRWLFGVWLPSLTQFVRHPITLAYLVASGLTGLGLTYYYNNTENRKINNMLRVALQLLGLASVYSSSSMTEASLAMCAALLAAKAREFVGRHRSFSSALASAKRKVQQQLAEGEELAEDVAEDMAEEKVAAGRGHAGAPATVAADGSKHRTPMAAGGRQAAAPEVSPLVQRGLILNEETGHIIGIGKVTYTRLVAAGYMVDRKAGTLTPPPPSPDSPAKSGRTGGRGRRRRAI